MDNKGDKIGSPTELGSEGCQMNAHYKVGKPHFIMMLHKLYTSTQINKLECSSFIA